MEGQQKPPANTATNNSNIPTSTNNNNHSDASSNAPLRRISNSSLESANSNRTDISTVVNASMSMHNTAPASPDPDRSEVSDSTISDNDEATEGTAGYAPKPGEIGAQHRWHHGSEQPPRMAPPPQQPNDTGVGLPPGAAQQGPNEGPGGPLSRKNFIQMVKEQFPKQHQNQQQQQHTHEGNEPIHHHMTPPQQSQQQSNRYPYGHNPPQQHGGGGQPPMRYGGRGPHHHQMQQQQHSDYPTHLPHRHYDHPSYPPHGGHPNNNNYDRMGGMQPQQHQPRYGYAPPQRQQQHPPQSHRFKAPPLHGRYPPPPQQQQQQSHDNPDFPIHGINHMKARVNNSGGGGSLTGAPHPSTLGGPSPHAPPMRHHLPMNHPSYMQPSPQPRPPYMQQPPPGSTPRPPTSMGNAPSPHDFFHGEPPPQPQQQQQQPQQPQLPPMQIGQPPSGPGSSVIVGPPQQQQQQQPPASNIQQQQQQMTPVTTTSLQQQQQHPSHKQPPTSTSMTDVSDFLPVGIAGFVYIFHYTLTLFNSQVSITRIATRP